MSEVSPELERVEWPFEVVGTMGMLDWQCPDGTVYQLPFFGATDQAGDPLPLHPFNTKLREFPNMPHINHLDVSIGDGTTGVQVESELFFLLKVNHFPVETWEFVDPATIAWLANRAIKNMDEELEGFNDDQS